MGRSSVFTLGQIYRKQINSTWSKIPEVFRFVNSVAVPETSGGPAYGYFAGGETPGGSSVSIIDRLDYGSDTTATAPKGNLSTPTPWFFATATSNANYGWFGAGGYGRSHVTRLDFSSDTSNTSPKGNLSGNKFYLAGTGNADFGYFIGGSPGERSTIDRVDYSNDTAAAATKGPLSVAKRITGATGNQSFGYAGGGATGNGGPDTTSVERIDYSNDTPQTSPKGPLSSARQYHTAHGNANFGYFVGDAGNGVPGGSSVIDRVDYSSDTATATRVGDMSNGVGYFAGTGSGSFGYSGGGSPKNSRVNRVDYSNDTATTTPVGNLTANKAYLYGAVSGQENGLNVAGTPLVPATRSETGLIVSSGVDFGYVGGGQAPGSNYKTNVDRIDYSNDTATASARGSLAVPASNSGTSSNNFGAYFGGGFGPGSASAVQKIEYASDTATSVVKGPLSSSGYTLVASGNINFGYFGSGNPYPVKSSMSRIEYANDTATSSPKGPLSVARGSMGGATGNQSFGYFAGGETSNGGPKVTLVDRIDYSNDTATASPKGPMGDPTYQCMVTGNDSFGYWAGGRPSGGDVTTIRRIDYSNDTATATPKGPLGIGDYTGCGTGNNSKGYICGGFNDTYVQRIDYSNDTTATTRVGDLNVDVYFLRGTSSKQYGNPSINVLPGPKTVDKGVDGYTISTPTDAANHGYFAGGYDYAEPSGPTNDMTLIQRIDFTNDTATALLKGNLSSTPGVHKSTSSNGSYGYIVGGNIVPSVTRVDRLDYTNDTATTSIRGPITGPVRGALAGAGNNDYGWHTGGIYAIPSRTVYSKVDRIDYSNDSSTASPKGNLAAARGYHNATGTLNYGYFAGGTPDGQFGPNSSTVQRIDYGNDTATASTKGPLSRGTSQLASTGNANYGWFIGGYGPSSRSKIDRIDYASDTSTASVRGPLYQPSYRLDGTGNANYGYVHPGLYPGNPAGPGGSTEIARIDYSNDTITTAIRGHFARSMRIQESAFSAAENGRNPVTTSYTPRIRWIDSLPEGISPEGNNGYFGAGSYNARSIVDRVDFNNDTATATPKGNMSSSRYKCTGMGNKSFGYFGGGRTTSPYTDVTTVDRLDYANDSTNMVAKGPLTNIHSTNDAGVGNDNFGYWCGSVGRSWVDRIEYANDTATASTKGALNYNRSLAYGVSSPSHGYVGGGETPAHRSNIDRIDFANDTATASLKGNMTQGKYAGGATGNASYGYFGGGVVMPNPTPISNIDRTDFSNDTVTALSKGPLARVNWLLSATGNTSYGYWGGGYGNSSYPNGLSIVDRLDYSNDTQAASPKGNTSVLFRNTSAFSPRENALPAPTITAPVQRPFSVPTQLPAPVPNPYGYVVGGSGNGDPNTVNNPAQRIDFTNDTATALVKAAPANPPGDRHYYSSATSNRDFAYSCMAGTRTYIQRLDYSNDSANFLIKGHRYTGFSNASSNYGGYNEAATGNLSYGYWNGGYKNYSSPVDPSICPNGHIQAYSHIDRIDYSNDTANSLRRSYTTTKRGGGAAAGTNEHGYWIGNGANQCSGSYAGTIVERTDYASDTTNASVRGNLSTSTDGGRAAGNKNYAWISGRQWHHTNVERIDYANDTATASIKGPLSAGRTYHQATGNQDYGYACGTHDFSLSYKSIVERIDYSNDTATGSPKGPLAYATSYGGGTSATLNDNGGTVAA